MRINFNKPFIIGKELYNIADAVLRGKLSGDGYYSRLCARLLEEQTGCLKAFIVHSCTAALEMSSIVLGLFPGDEVIVPSFTFVSTANAFAIRGIVPVFVDINSTTFSIDTSKIEQCITSKTKAIVPVHYGGVCADMRSIQKISKAYGLFVIEDAAQGILSFDNDGNHLGSIGNLGCLSFHETKNVISGEGGALLVNDPDLIEKSEVVWEKGTNRQQFFNGLVDKYTWVDLGSSYYPSELVSAFLYEQLLNARKITQKRVSDWNNYYDLLSPLQEDGLLTLPNIPAELQHNAHSFYCVFHSQRVRDNIMEILRKNGMCAVFHYIPLHNSPAGLKYGRTGTTMENTIRISNCLLRLPLFFEITRDEIEEIVTIIKKNVF